MLGLAAFVSSCQKEEMPSPDGGCMQHDTDGNTQRLGDPEENNSGGFMGDGNGPTPTADSIVSGGDDDKDGGGIVGGGDDDKDGGRKGNDGSKNK